jgi:hypothetical protein
MCWGVCVNLCVHVFLKKARVFFFYMHASLSYVDGLTQVDDTRTTLQYVADELHKMGPASVSWLTVFNKLKLKRGIQPPTLANYWFAHTTADIWIRFPWYAREVNIMLCV